MSLQESEGHCERAITAEQVGIAACEDCCLQGSLKGKTVAVSSVGVREDTERVCGPTHHHTWKRVGKTMGSCVAVLCVDVDTVHGCCKMTGLPFLLHEKCRVKPRG